MKARVSTLEENLFEERMLTPPQLLIERPTQC